MPAAILERLPQGARVLEVGVGGRFEVASGLLEARPDIALTVSDVRPEALRGAPEGVNAAVLDAHAPPPHAPWDLVFATRPGEEMQPALARLASSAGAMLAMRPLAGELVEPLPGVERVAILADDQGGAWHVYEPSVG